MPNARTPGEQLAAGLAALGAVHTAARDVADQLAAERAAAATTTPPAAPAPASEAPSAR